VVKDLDKVCSYTNVTAKMTYSVLKIQEIAQMDVLTILQDQPASTVSCPNFVLVQCSAFNYI